MDVTVDAAVDIGRLSGEDETFATSRTMSV